MCVFLFLVKSMPTGSLCAERNVIGTALAMDPGLRREDLRMVAVLAVPLKTLDNPSSRSSTTTLPLTPYCLPANDELDSNEIMCQSSNQDNDQPSPTYNNNNNRMARSLSFGSFASIVEEDNDDYNLWYQKDSKEEKKICDVPVPKLPVRRIKLHTKGPTTSSRNGSSTKKKKTVIVHSHEVFMYFVQELFSPFGPMDTHIYFLLILYIGYKSIETLWSM